MPPIRPKKRSRFEPLERRLSMAGNVTAALVGADLVITGDSAANVISLVETENDGEFVVLAESDASGAPTTRNGTPNGLATVSGVTGNIVINMHGGPDVVTMANIDHPRSLQVDAGHNDADRRVGASYSLFDSSIGKWASFVLGVRAGSVTVENTTIGGGLYVSNSSLAFPSAVAMLRLGSVYAGIQLNNVIVGREISIDSSAATLVQTDNVFAGQHFRIQGHASSNAFLIRNSRAVGGLTISTITSGPILHFGLVESAYDFLEISGVVADGGLTTSTNGEVRVAYSYFGAETRVVTNATDDIVIIDTNLFDANVTIAPTKAHDWLEFKNSVVNGTLSVIHSNLYGYSNGPVDPQQRSFPEDGSSVVTLANNRIRTLYFNGGRQTDEFRLLYSIIDQFFADLDWGGEGTRGGSDLLEITGSAFSQGARLDGGAGFDLFRSTGNTFNGLELLNFEAF
jgi:hypothetical protein